MNLYLLQRIEDDGNIYDCYDGHVIRANSEAEARLMASKVSADEGSNTWLEPSSSTCIEIIPDGKVEIILSDFHAG